MTNLTKKLLGVLVLLCTFAVASAQEAAVDIDRTDPYMMVQDVATKTFSRMKAQEQDILNNPEVLRTIMEEELMPYIDYRFSAYKVLGKYARGVEKKDLLEFITVFREYLITSYAVAMGYYDNQIVEFDPIRDFSDRTDVTVRAVIIDDVRPDIKIAFKVRKDRNGEEWQAYDMIAEGISLLSSKQSEFEAILRKEGIQEVITQMRASINQPVELNNDKAKQAEASI
ncbi:phospholipid-binding protein MlaC [Glaciecola sp. SC05]|uniref:MlaC/ttg2D family ABC transporter substrate-binding protein n=1 Tax=Glaciecola sp. SC05 TaxID=1987355 RepID=UPI0035276AFD